MQAAAPAESSLTRTSMGMGVSCTYQYLLDHAVKGLLAELENEEDVEVEYDKDDPRFLKIFGHFVYNTFNNQYQKSMQSIVITRDVGQAELFDEMPSPGVGFWMTLLCHGGSLVSEFIDRIDGDRTKKLAACRWYPRTLFTKLLQVGNGNLIG